MVLHVIKQLTRHPLVSGQWVPALLKAAIASWQLGLKQFWHPQAKALQQAGAPVVYALWHGRLFGCLVAFAKQNKPAVLISQSRDGNFVTRVAMGVGYKRVLRGSYQRGGHGASKQLLNTLKHQSVLVTCDGPRGPRYQLKPTLLKVLAKAGVPIIPVAATCCWPLAQFTGSWDHFVAPNFFSPITIHFDAPLSVDPKVLEDPACLQQELHRINTAIQLASQHLDERAGKGVYFRL
jgi:lysophospholipid acyltransferase (LPLAT)-like uncharacterized protein